MSATTQNTTNDDAEPTLQRLFALVTAAVIGRAAVVAIVLGSVLAVANQSAAIFGANDFQILPLALVYLTPFIVVTISQVFGIRQAQLDRRPGRLQEQGRRGFLHTMRAHGIPGRSLVIGLAVGSVNTTIAIAAALLAGADVGAIAAAPVVQAFVLPMLFGLISQTLSYRRAAAAIRQRPGIDTAPALG